MGKSISFPLGTQLELSLWLSRLRKNLQPRFGLLARVEVFRVRRTGRDDLLASGTRDHLGLATLFDQENPGGTPVSFF